MSNRIQLTKLMAMNPPPLFDTNPRFGSASGLLSFLNEELEDYFSDICVEDKTEKCRLLLKIFGGKSEEYKRTTRRFFKQSEIQTLIEDPDTEMRIVYKELVHYMFVEKPKGNVGVRKNAESLTNFLERWFTLKNYCGVPVNKQGKSVIAGIFKNPSILNCSAEVIREFKKEFFVKHANDQNIDKAAILGFAQRLDMLFSGENELGVHALNSAVDIRETGMVAIDKQRSNDDMKDIKSHLADLVSEIKDSRNNNKPYNKQAKNNFGIKHWNNMNTGSKDTNYDGCWTCGADDHMRRDCPQYNQGSYNGNKKGGKGSYNNNNKNKYNKGSFNNKNRNYNNTRNGGNSQGINAFEVDTDSFCVMGMGNDMREYVDTAIVPGSSERSLLDTGATMDAISAQLLTECGLADKVSNAEAGRVALADGTSVKIEGTIVIPVEVNNKKHKVQFKVVDKLQPKIIYGIPFLEETGILNKFRESVREHLGKKNNSSKN